MIEMKGIYWAAGFIEGEGSFGVSQRTGIVTASQVEHECLERLRRIFGGNIYTQRNGRTAACNGVDVGATDAPAARGRSAAAAPGKRGGLLNKR